MIYLLKKFKYFFQRDFQQFLALHIYHLMYANLISQMYFYQSIKEFYHKVKYNFFYLKFHLFILFKNQIFFQLFFLMKLYYFFI